MATSRNENYQRQVSVPIFGRVTFRDLFLAAGLAFGVLGIVMTAVSIYLTVREPETKITFEILSATDVLDLRRALDDLRIEFRGQDLQAQDLNLRVVKINVINSGETHIRTDDYSDTDWGITIKGGQVIEAKVDRSDAANLISTDDLHYIGNDTVALPKIIFDRGDAFSVEMLLLHTNDVEPTVVPIGKIAGLQNFDLAYPPSPGQGAGFIVQALGGDPMAVVFRSAVYVIGSVMVVFASVLILIGITMAVSDLKERRRRKRASRTQAVKAIDRVRVRDGLVELYGSTGLPGLRRLADIVAEPSGIRWMPNSGEWLIVDRQRERDQDILPLAFDIGDWQVFSSARETLLAMGTLYKGEGNEAVIDPAVNSAVEALVAELENDKPS